MAFGPKRGHFLYIFENFFKDFSLLILTIAIALFQGNMDLVLENLGVLAVVLIMPVSRVIEYLTTTYGVDAEKLTVKRGLLHKHVLEVPLSTITTVDFSQNVLHQIFHVYRLNVDNASNVAGTKTQVKMTFKKEDAFAVRELLIAGRTGLDGLNLGIMQGQDAETGEDRDTAEEGTDAACRRIDISTKDLILMGILKSKAVFFWQLFALILSAATIFNINISKGAGEKVAQLLLEFGVLPSLLILFALVFIAAIFCGMAGSLIRYYGFHLMDNGAAVKIEYGLLTKKRYTIQKTRIGGFSYQQSLLMRIFKTGTLQLFAIGYGSSGDEGSSEEPILFPLLPEEKLRAAMGALLPEMKTESAYTGPAPGSFRYFFYGFGFLMTLTALGASIYASFQIEGCRNLWIAGILLLIYSIAGRVQEYRHAALSSNKDNISLCRGGYEKKTVFVKTTHVESTSAGSSIWKQKKDIVNVTVSYIAPLASSSQKVKNLPVQCFENVHKTLIY